MWRDYWTLANHSHLWEHLWLLFMIPFPNTETSLKFWLVVFYSFPVLHPWSHLSISNASNDALVGDSLIILISFCPRIFYYLSAKYFNSNKTAPSQVLFSHSKFFPFPCYCHQTQTFFCSNTFFPVTHSRGL